MLERVDDRIVATTGEVRNDNGINGIWGKINGMSGLGSNRNSVKNSLLPSVRAD